jgi:hypothetical protein
VRVDRFQLAAQRVLLRAERAERAVRVGDRLLGGTQRVARLLAVGFLPVEFVAQRADALPQRGQVGLLVGRRVGARRRGRGDQGEGCEDEKPAKRQVFALPCAATAATRCATSSALPR